MTNDAWMIATAPADLMLADRTIVPHAVGVRIFNYYDRKPGLIERVATRPQPDTSGMLPDGVAWWVDVRHDDGSACSLDGSRMCSIDTARSRGWVK